MFKLLYPVIKRNPEKDLQHLVTSLQAAMGEDLKSLVLYGSMASGDFNPDSSNINLLLVLTIRSETLNKLHPTLRGWTHKGYRMPILVEDEDVQSMPITFPVEYADLMDHKRVLAGSDPFTGAVIDKKRLADQCLFELSAIQTRLRQLIVYHGIPSKKLAQAAAESYRHALVLWKAMWRLDHAGTPPAKVEAAKQVARKVGASSEAIGGSGYTWLEHYLDFLEKSLDALRSRNG